MPVDRINLWTLIGGTLITERQLPLFSVVFFIQKKKVYFCTRDHSHFLL